MERLIARAIFADQGLTIRRKRHATAAFGAHKSLRVGLRQMIGRGGQCIGIHDFIGFDFSVEDGKRTASASMLQIIG